MITDDHVSVQSSSLSTATLTGDEILSVLKSTCMRWAYMLSQTKYTPAYAEVSHDELSQDPLHDGEESKVGLKKNREIGNIDTHTHPTLVQRG